eukprot:Filipodium_phascolosomae@DN1592_c0_g1_i1.p1
MPHARRSRSLPLVPESDDIKAARSKNSTNVCFFNSTCVRSLSVRWNSFFELVRNHQNQLPLWVVASIIIIFFYHICSDGDYSFMLTASSFVGFLSFLMMLSKIIKSKEIGGVSREMMKCYSLLSLSRLSSILFFDSYLPFDSSGDYIYRFGEILNFAVSCTILIVAKYWCRSSEDGQRDDTVKFYVLALPALLVALFIHPSLNENKLTDVAWAFALYLECVAVVPQLFMFNRLKMVEATTTHFIAAQSHVLC